MFVPIVFTMDTYSRYENFYYWPDFYIYADACIKNKWPFISHERYFERFSHLEETVFGHSMQDIISFYSLNNLTTENMLVLNAYPISQTDEDALIAKYPSQFDCWVDLLKNESSEFERIIGELLDRITADFGEKPEGILTYEYLPKALLRAAHKREIPVIFQGIGVIRPPFAPAMINAFSLINDNSAEFVKSRYDRFMSENTSAPMLSRKGILRLFVSEQYMMDIHNIDNEPEYDVGVLHTNPKHSLYHIGQELVSNQEMSDRAKERFNRVLIRTRAGFEPTEDALDNSPTCFHFCCKCKRVVGFATKGMFEAMLAGRIAHEYGSFIFHSFCNHGIGDESKGLAPIEFLNFILFGLCTPFTWLAEPNYLRFLLSNPSEEELYMRSFNYFMQGISKEDLELYYMSNNRAYRLGDTLYFTSGHKPHEYAAYYCLGGLRRNGEICTWSNGENTSFEFDLTEPINEPLTISVVLYEVVMDWNSPNPVQTVTCEAGGINCGSVTLAPGEKNLKFTIPAECFTDKLQVIFRYSYLHTEGDLQLGIAFERMYISRAGQRLIEDAMSDEIAGLTYKVSELEAHNSRLEAQIQSIYNTRSWKLGNGIMKAAAKIVPRKN